MANTCCYALSPCQDETITTIIEEQLAKVDGMEHVDEFIKEIEKLINEIPNGRRPPYLDSSESVASFIKSVGNPIQNRLKHLNWHVCKECLLSAVDIETVKAVTAVLKVVKHMECATIMLSIIVYLLERGEQVSSNRDQCIRLLRYIHALAKHMKTLNNHSDHDQTKLENILRFIVKATVICALQMATHSCCRFMCAPLDKDDLNALEIELRDKYQELQFDTITKIAENLPAFPPPTQGEYPHYAVGIDNALYKLIELMDLKDPSRRAVVIYGVGGIGKTTLANAVFSRLELSGHPYCRVLMDKNSNMPIMQEQILRDLFKKHLRLNNCTEGQEKLLEAFTKASVPVFLFIDNVLRKSDLEKLLPVRHLSGLHMLSKILITTRNLYDACIFQPHDIEFFFHQVEPLLEPEAKKLLCQHANPCLVPDDDMSKLLQICGGIPLLLETIGKELCIHGTDESSCRERIEYYKEWGQEGFRGEEDGSEPMVECMVDFVYNQWRQLSQEAFLDVAFFFYDWDRSQVSDIVGEMELRDLEGAALVTISEEDKVKMHDIARARARRLSAGNRITKWESWTDLVKNKKELPQTKGIWLRGDDRHINVEAEHIDSMSTFLRVLSLGKCGRLRGQCQRDFPNLRFLEISYVEDKLPIHLRESQRLHFLIVHLRGHRMEFTINLPESSQLRYLEVDASDSPAVLYINGDLTNVKSRLASNITLRTTGSALSPFERENYPNGEIMSTNVLQIRTY